MLYNESKREFHLVFNGKNNTRTNNVVTILPSRCVGPCLAEVKEEAMENRTRYWS